MCIIIEKFDLFQNLKFALSDPSTIQPWTKVLKIEYFITLDTFQSTSVSQIKYDFLCL